MNVQTKETESTIDVVLTDVQLHTQQHRKPLSFFRKILQSLRNRKPGRVYGGGIKAKPDGTFEMFIPFPKEIRERAELTGKRIRLLAPQGGLPVFLGPDAVEYIKARERKGADGAWIGHSK